MGDAPAARDERIRWIHNYWQERRGDRPMPARSDVDPLDMPPKLLPHLMLVNVAHDPLRLTYRLVGTAIVERDGFDRTGMAVEQAYTGPSREEVLASYRQVISERRWDYLDLEFVDERTRKRMRAERILLPLSSDGETVDMILVCIIFGDRGER